MRRRGHDTTGERDVASHRSDIMPDANPPNPPPLTPPTSTHGPAFAQRPIAAAGLAPQPARADAAGRGWVGVWGTIVAAAGLLLTVGLLSASGLLATAGEEVEERPLLAAALILTPA